MPIAPIQAPRRTAGRAANEKGLLNIVERMKALPILTPPPGVYPKVTLSFEPDTPAPEPYNGVAMFGFWPPSMARVSNGVLQSAGEISHLMVYVNYLRAEAFDRTYWKDAEGTMLPQPKQAGALQGFPIYQGFGGVEVAGTMVIQPPGRSTFAPVSRERFHAFEVGDIERQMTAGEPALRTAQAKYQALVSPEGRLAQEKRITDSLAQYAKTRPRTPEQMRYREEEVRRLEKEAEERLRVDATPEGNRLLGPLAERLAKARSAQAALTPAERGEQACHAEDSRVMGRTP